MLCNRRIRLRDDMIMRRIPRLEYNELQYFCCAEHAKAYYFGERRPQPPTADDKLQEYMRKPVKEDNEAWKSV